MAIYKIGNAMWDVKMCRVNKKKKKKRNNGTNRNVQLGTHQNIWRKRKQQIV